MTPSLAQLDEGCAFRERCTRAMTDCRAAPPVRAPSAGRSLRCVNPVP
jgi:ABC-type dipeptide/oligopeptide/nickel transport system ATPase component